MIVVTVFATVLGLAIGSFLNVVAYRIPAGLSVVWLVARLLVCDGTKLGGCVAVEKGERRTRPPRVSKLAQHEPLSAFPCHHLPHPAEQAHRGNIETVSPK